MIRYKPHLPMLFLKQNEMSILSKPMLVSTILGSCVAVTLFSPRLGVAAISHSYLPHCRTRKYVDNIRDLLCERCLHCPEAFKYVDCAVSMMVEAFTRFGVTPGETQVQLFGGAKMIDRRPQAVNIPIGTQNSDTAQKVIADQGLRIAVQDIGGATGRKIYFDTQTGHVSMLLMREQAHDRSTDLPPYHRGKAHAAEEENSDTRCR